LVGVHLIWLGQLFKKKAAAAAAELGFRDAKPNDMITKKIRICKYVVE
jgi:hypothetical protein